MSARSGIGVSLAVTRADSSFYRRPVEVRPKPVRVQNIAVKVRRDRSKFHCRRDAANDHRGGIATDGLDGRVFVAGRVNSWAIFSAVRLQRFVVRSDGENDRGWRGSAMPGSRLFLSLFFCQSISSSPGDVCFRRGRRLTEKEGRKTDMSFQGGTPP